MDFMMKALGWVTALFFLFLALTLGIQTPLSAVPMAAAALLFIPQVRAFVFQKTNWTLSPTNRAFIAFGLFITSAVILTQSEQAKQRAADAELARVQAQEQARMKQANLDHFLANKDAVLQEVESLLNSDATGEAIDLAKLYLHSEDPELSALNDQAVAQIQLKKHRARESVLLAELKTIPAAQLEENRVRYLELAEMFPDNARYQEKYRHYLTKVTQAKREAQLAAQRKERIEKQFSAWDGSHHNLERAIKRAMNDPSSYEHDETVYWDMGDHLVVQMRYRGSNAFGAIILTQTKAKVTLDGHIIQILDRS
ncbi:hypothetical protein [Ferrimonas marina]|uniref:Uncharacterized protein n=1 Tax=Ferrimonas marina TaxID=299255 RepID=A0A1M5TXJ5_9GAMM|nr:hypothetical protein [Ferrimonas marina]SHH55340.1 hypothetical protein SAMN02745129_2314 [Ferrimonas marina]